MPATAAIFPALPFPLGPRPAAGPPPPMPAPRPAAGPRPARQPLPTPPLPVARSPFSNTHGTAAPVIAPFPPFAEPGPAGWSPPQMPPVPPPAPLLDATPGPTLADLLPPLADNLPPEGTDAELVAVLSPMLEEAVGHVLYAPSSGLHEYLEPMLRTTVRRAIAEMDGPDQAFRPPGFLDRLLWRLQALFTSRTYDEIVFEKTRRHRVDAALLLDREALDMISYASADPGCHSSPRRIQPLLREVLPRIRDDDGALQLSFELPDSSSAIVREGKHTFLVIIVRGALDEFAVADIDFIQRRIEERHGERLHDPSAPLLHRIQPLLEDCLLVRSPAAG